MKARVYIRPPLPDDMQVFVEAVCRSKALHKPYIAAPDTAAKFRAYLEKMVAPSYYPFLVVRRDTEELAGVFNISNVIRGMFHCGYLGYYAFAGHERQGLMREGLQVLLKHAFKSMKLHRLEANIQPGNAASVALAASCGFRKEGYSPRYLKVRGRWRDHERWAITAS